MGGDREGFRVILLFLLFRRKELAICRGIVSFWEAIDVVFGVMKVRWIFYPFQYLKLFWSLLMAFANVKE